MLNALAKKKEKKKSSNHLDTVKKIILYFADGLQGTDYSRTVEYMCMYTRKKNVNASDT